MELVLKRRYHAEISASSTNRPKKIRIGVLTGLHLPSIDRHELRRSKVVAGSAVLRHQLPFSSAKRQASNSYGRATARRCGQAESLRRLVQVAHECTGLCSGHALALVDCDSVHSREINYHAAIAHAEPSSVVASATHGQRQILALRKIECACDVRRAGAANDQRRTPIECEIENQARRLIVGHLWGDHVSGNLGSQIPNCRRIERSCILLASSKNLAPAAEQIDRRTVNRRRG